MIIYFTRQTIERYKIVTYDKMEEPIRSKFNKIIENVIGDRLFEWGAKLFYFDRRKCLQLVNFASKFTIFLIDLKMDMFEEIGNYMAYYLFELYEDDAEMTMLLEEYFNEIDIIVYSSLKDRSIISTLNTTQKNFADDGYRFYDFIEDGILKSVKINWSVNFNWIFTMKNGKKTEYFMSGEKFKELLRERYKDRLKYS